MHVELILWYDQLEIKNWVGIEFNWNAQRINPVPIHCSS